MEVMSFGEEVTEVKCHFHYIALLWTKYVCPPKILMLKPKTQCGYITKPGLWEMLK